MLKGVAMPWHDRFAKQCHWGAPHPYDERIQTSGFHRHARRAAQGKSSSFTLQIENARDEIDDRDVRSLRNRAAK